MVEGAAVLATATPRRKRWLVAQPSVAVTLPDSGALLRSPRKRATVLHGCRPISEPQFTRCLLEGLARPGEPAAAVRSRESAVDEAAFRHVPRTRTGDEWTHMFARRTLCVANVDAREAARTAARRRAGLPDFLRSPAPSGAATLAPRPCRSRRRARNISDAVSPHAGSVPAKSALRSAGPRSNQGTASER
jgi:hypothetical protein